MTKHNMENKMFVFTLDPHGEQITSIGQLFKEYWHLRKVQKCLLKHNYCGSKDFTGARNGVISDCEEYLDVWTYDEDGEPVQDSEFISAMSKATVLCKLAKTMFCEILAYQSLVIAVKSTHRVPARIRLRHWLKQYLSEIERKTLTSLTERRSLEP